MQCRIISNVLEQLFYYAYLLYYSILNEVVKYNIGMSLFKKYIFHFILSVPILLLRNTNT